MAIKNDLGEWSCSICTMTYPTPAMADSCRDAHKVVYVPIERDDLNRLVMFLQLKDETLLTERLVKRLQQYNRKSR